MWLLIVSTVVSFVVVSRATTWQQTPETVCPCEGMTAHLSWRYTLEGTEAFNLVRWYQGKPVGLQIATYQLSSDTFTPNAPYDAPGKLAFDNTKRNHSVSITMNNVMLNDSSQYSVTLQPVGDNTNGFLRVQKGGIGCSLVLSPGNYNLTLYYTEAMGGTDREMNVTVYHNGSIIRSCTTDTECTVLLPDAIDLMETIVSVSLGVNGTACYQFTQPFPPENTTVSPTPSEGPYVAQTTPPPSRVKLCCFDGTCVNWTAHIAAFCIGAILILIGIIIVIVLMCKNKDNRRLTVVMIMLAVSVLSVIVGGIIIIWFLFTENSCLESVSFVVAVVVTVLVCLLIIGVVIAVVVWWRLKGRHACSANRGPTVMTAEHNPHGVSNNIINM